MLILHRLSLYISLLSRLTHLLNQDLARYNNLMIVTPVKTDKIMPGFQTIEEVLDKYIDEIEDRSVIAITSKIISVCEGSLAPIKTTDKEQLIISESDLYLPAQMSRYGHHFSIVNDSLIAVAGIDESNGAGNYILWPKDPQKTANQIRQYLSKKYNLSGLGVVITDSTSKPLRLGTVGLCVAHSGFLALKDYRDTADLFGHKFTVSVANFAEGLAATAVMVMGEGTEQTPLVTISELPFIKFQNRNPSGTELQDLLIPMDEDLFAPFLKSAKWQKGGRKS